MIIDTPCPFCDFNKLNNQSWQVMWEPFPLGIGHVKIIPRRHEADFFNLTPREKNDFWKTIEDTKIYLDGALDKHKPEGYNLGINLGEAAGQTIRHLHIHLIPRYKGDDKNPRGGIRKFKKALIDW